MNRDIRLIASDLDGTLLTSRGEITPDTIKAIKKAQDKGIIFAICTGRFPENAAQIMINAGIECPIISLNGAVVETSPNGKRLLEVFLQKDAQQAVFDTLEGMGEGYYMFGKATVDSRRDYPRHISEVNAKQLKILQKRVRYRYGLEACQGAVQHPLHKFFVYRSEQGHSLEEINAALSRIDGIEITQSSSRNLEVMPVEADKGKGLKALAEHFGITREQTMSLGDQLNDLPMIKAAGFGVAMGNAVPDVQQHADAVTDSNNDDGVAKAIMKYCLNG
ncbi:MAG: HAD family phosphatase [Clostridiales bacterium]|jgi:Cof subfamily protein (haloacid dehalogenase superfamily)|nr:HAD family phosphatase [Clostridiales bacterium]